MQYTGLTRDGVPNLAIGEAFVELVLVIEVTVLTDAVAVPELFRIETTLLDIACVLEGGSMP